MSGTILSCDVVCTFYCVIKINNNVEEVGFDIKVKVVKQVIMLPIPADILVD